MKADGGMQKVTATNVAKWASAGLLAEERSTKVAEVGRTKQVKRGTAGFKTGGRSKIGGFIMRIGPGDAGTAAGLSGEIWVPVGALRQESAFFGWDNENDLNSTRRGDDQQREVGMELKGVREKAIFWYYGARTEFRIRCRPLRAEAREGDLLHLERRSKDEYRARLIRAPSTEYAEMDGLCSEKAPGPSPKRYGFYVETTIQEGEQA